MNSLAYVMPSERVRRPLVSIIVTSFNYARYLEACLQSIAEQTYTEFECVIVDDASRDHSVEVIDTFIRSERGGDRFRLVRHLDNRGQMAAFQTGLQHTTGRFVVFVDADDVLFPDFLETHVRAHLNASYEAAVTNSDQFQIGADGEILSGTHIVMYKNRGNARTIARGAADGQCEWDFVAGQPLRFQQPRVPLEYYHPWEVPQWGWMWSTTSAAMFRRDVLDMIMSEACRSLRICADSYLFHFGHALGGTLIIPEVHGCYRRHGDNHFSNNPILGGFNSPGDVRRDPKALARQLSLLHAVVNFERIHAAIGRARIAWLLKYFGGGRAFLRLTLSRVTFPGDMLEAQGCWRPEDVFWPSILGSSPYPWRIAFRLLGRSYLRLLRWGYARTLRRRRRRVAADRPLVARPASAPSPAWPPATAFTNGRAHAYPAPDAQHAYAREAASPTGH